MHHPRHSRRFNLSALALTLGLATAGVGAHAGGHRGHGPGPDFSPERMMHLMERLDVTDAQRDQIFAIVDEVQPQLRKVMFARRDTHKELRGLLARGPADAATVERLAARAGEQAAQAVRLTAGLMGRVSALLTPAQRDELTRLLERRGHG
ncbi:MAG: Spy/CpxP family protein refolding chaperone [Gammaproteobacteria bacterium]